MSVTAAKGFRAAGVVAGLKDSGRPDLALVVNNGPRHAAAGVFTTNRVVAAPVVWSRDIIQGLDDDAAGGPRAVVLNSGSANACTGARGASDAAATAAHVAGLLGCEAAEVLVCSTGVIGVPLDMPRLLAGTEAAAGALQDSPAGAHRAAQAIMTTDTVPKEDALEVDGAQGRWTIGGMIKGVGMLAPGMATMLAVLTTDAAISHHQAQRALSAATARTVNRINSDGCMSTNDTVLLLASGASGAIPDQEELDDAVAEVLGRLGRRLWPTPRVPPTTSPSPSPGPSARPPPRPPPAPSAPPTSSSAPSRAGTPTGGGCSPSWAPCPRRSAPSTPRRWTWPSTG